ncbi:MAG: hypothetical protein IPJ33_19550 [Gammaproteobacteria bacterium]|nr:hypothetical protein [Gammaproteobacteria bacterium]
MSLDRHAVPAQDGYLSLLFLIAYASDRDWWRISRVTPAHHALSLGVTAGGWSFFGTRG